MADTNASAQQILSIGFEDISDQQTAFISSYACGGRTFEILVTDDPPPGYDRDSTEVDWMHQLSEISLHDGTDPDKIDAHDCFLIDLDEKIKEIVNPKLLELAPPVLGSPPPQHPINGVRTVQEHLYPDVVKLQLVSRGGSFDLIQGHQLKQGSTELKPIRPDHLPGWWEDIASLPKIPASEVLLLSRFAAGATAYDATIRGRSEAFVCKLLSDFFRKSFERELEIFAKIQKAAPNLSPQTRTSTLKAIITHEGCIVGLLMDKIPAKFPVLDKVIKCQVHVPLPLRKKWAAQIERTVSDLHRYGIVWGDSKPGNVIIDEHDDAWLVDFGGGYTPGWVDESLFESVEGDLQAVKKMKEKLEKEE